MEDIKTYRVKVSEAGLGYYHAFKLWPEAHTPSENQDKVLNLFEFLIQYGKEIAPCPAEFNPSPNEGRNHIEHLAHVFAAYEYVHTCSWRATNKAIGITVGFFNFLIHANMLIIEEVYGG